MVVKFDTGGPFDGWHVAVYPVAIGLNGANGRQIRLMAGLAQLVITEQSESQ